MPQLCVHEPNADDTHAVGQVPGVHVCWVTGLLAVQYVSVTCAPGVTPDADCTQVTVAVCEPVPQLTLHVLNADCCHW